MRQRNPQQRRLYTEEGGYYTLPDWVTDEQIEEFRRRHPEILDDPTLLGAVGEGIKNIPKGIAGTALSVGRGITAIAPGDTGAGSRIEELQRRLGESVDPRYRESLISQTGMGLGSALTFMAPGAGIAGLAGRGAGLAASGAMGSLSGAGEQATRMAMLEEAGEDINVFERAIATAGGLAVGATEAAPFGRLFSKVAPEALEAGARKAAQNWIGSAVTQGMQEGLQELGAATGQNIIERVVYNPRRELAPNMSEGIVGFGSGFLIDLMTRGATAGYGRLSQSAAYTAEHEERLSRLQKEVEEIATELDESENIEESLAEIQQRTYDVVQNDDGSYAIVDQAGAVVAPALVDTNAVDQAMQNLSDRDVTAAAVGGIMLKLRNQGIDTDPHTVHLGLLASHPDYTHVPSSLVSRFMTEEVEGRKGARLDPRSMGAREALQAGPLKTPFISLAKAREIMPESDFDAMADELALLGAAQIASLNRDVAANLTSTGIPKLRYHDASNEYVDNMLEAAKSALADEHYNLESISVSDIRNLMEAKGYHMRKNPMKDKDFKYLVTQLIGTEKLNKDGDKRLLFTRLASLPARRGAPAGGYLLPDLTPPRYTQAQYNRALGILRDTGEQSFDDFSAALNMSVPARDQMLSHLERAGLIKVSRNRKSVAPVDPDEIQLNKNLDSGIEAIEEAADLDGVPRTMLEETFEKVRQANALAAEVTEEQVDESQGSPQEKADYLTEASQRIKSVHEKLSSYMRSLNLMAPDTAIEIREDFSDIIKSATRQLVEGKQPVAAFVSDPKNAQTKILLNLGAFDPNGDMEAEQLFHEMLPSFNKELLRWFREHDYFTQREWEALRRFVRKNVVPETVPDGAGKTWFDWAREELGDPTGFGSQEAVHEDAIAKAFEAFANNQLTLPEKPGSLTPDNVFRRMTDHAKDVIGIGKEARVGPALSLFAEALTGRIGIRGPGLGPMNPQGEVRSLKLTERDVLAEQRAFERASEDAGAEPNAEPRRAALSDEEIAQVTANQIKEVDASIGIPRVGNDVSPEALNIYYNARDHSGKLSENIRFKYKPKQNPDPYISQYRKPTKYELDDRLPFERVRDAIKANKLLEDPGGLWDDLTTRFKESFVHGRLRVEKVGREVNARRKAQGEHEHLADMSAIAAFNWLDSSMHYVKSAITQGKLVFKDGLFQTEILIDSKGRSYRGLRDVFALVENDEQTADNYLIAKRIIQLKEAAQRAVNELRTKKGQLSSAQKRSLNKQKLAGKYTPGNMSLEEARAYVKDIESDPRLQNVVQFGEAFRAWNDSLIDLMADTGMLSAIDVDRWKNKMYLPFYKTHERDEFASLNPFARKAPDRATWRATIEDELVGSSEEIDKDMITRIVSNAEMIIRDAMTNNAYSKIARDMVYLGMGTEEDHGDVNTIGFWEDGERKYIKVDDPYLIQAVAASDHTLIRGIWKLLGPGPARILRESVTRNPAFLIRNILRDTLSVFVTSGSNYMPFIDSIKRMNMGSYRKAQSLGLALEHDFVNDASRYRSQIKSLLREGEGSKNWFLKAWDKMGYASRMSDAATRMAVYEDVLERTGNHAEATYQAFEIINFGRRGRDPLWRAISSSIPFLNARIQGLDVLWRAGTGQYSARAGETKQHIQMRVMLRGMMLASMTGLYYALVSDQDWYKNLREETKNDYWMLPVPGTEALFKMPIPFEVGIFTKAIPEMAIRLAQEEGYAPTDAIQTLSRAARQSLMFRLSPQIMSPAIDLMNNRNAFTGREIVPEWMLESLEDEEKRSPETNELATAIGEALNVSPTKIEYLVNGYLGPMGTYAFMLGDKVAREFRDAPTAGGTRQDIGSIEGMPVIRSLFQRMQDGGGYQQSFYELRNEVNKAVTTYNKQRREGRFEDAMALRNEKGALMNLRGTVASLDRYMQNWRLRRDRILLNRNLTTANKRELIRMMEEERDLQLAIVPFMRESVEAAR